MDCSIDVFISSAQRFLHSGKKRKQPSTSLCLDLAVQIIAVDLGLKPSLLYDINGACAEEIQQYVSSLQQAGALRTTLQIFSISGNTLVVNPHLMKAHLEDVLQRRSLLTVDVCPWRDMPALRAMDNKTENMVQAMLNFFTEKEEQRWVTVVKEELYGQWNLCTLFGILLGYPASYWFDQDQTFENCLNMTPIVVNKVSVCWPVNNGKHCSCLYSFSIPQVLWSEVNNHVEQWQELLRSRVNKQTVLTELSFSKETVILPAVTL